MKIENLNWKFSISILSTTPTHPLKCNAEAVTLWSQSENSGCHITQTFCHRHRHNWSQLPWSFHHHDHQYFYHEIKIDRLKLLRALDSEINTEVWDGVWWWWEYPAAEFLAETTILKIDHSKKIRSRAIFIRISLYHHKHKYLPLGRITPRDHNSRPVENMGTHREMKMHNLWFILLQTMPGVLNWYESPTYISYASQLKNEAKYIKKHYCKQSD